MKTTAINSNLVVYEYDNDKSCLRHSIKNSKLGIFYFIQLLIIINLEMS